MSALRADVKRLTEQLSNSANCAISSLTLEDSSVSFRLSVRKTTIRVSANYNDIDTYPNSGVYLWTEDNDEANERLSDVNERFESKAQLEALLSKVDVALSQAACWIHHAYYGLTRIMMMQICQVFKVPFLSQGSSDAAGDTTADPATDDGAEDMDEDYDSQDGGSDYDMDDDAASLSDGDDRELMQQVAVKRSR